VVGEIMEYNLLRLHNGLEKYIPVDLTYTFSEEQLQGTDLIELKDVKIELTDALEKTTRKYFDQLDISADLSNKIGKIGAENAVNKVRADKLESEVDSIKEEYEAKLSDLENQIDTTDLDNVKKENSKLNKEIKELKDKLADSRKENINLSDEVDKLRAEIIEFGNYKEEVETQSKKEVQGLNDELSDLRTQLKIKESSYDKLSNESGKTIADLRKQVEKLEEKLEKESNKGLFNRFK
jgi:chromosome segregation ATPase